MRFTSFLFKAILVVQAVVILALVVVAVKNGQTSHGGWDWSLEFMAGLLANVVASLLFVLWFEAESQRHLDKLLNQFERPGRRVISHRDRLARETYEKHYETSDEVEILGIACKPVLSGLFPNYKRNTAFALDECQSSVLYRRLTNGNPFKADIYFLNPSSPYAAERDGEAENNGTLADLRAAVAAFEAIVRAYRNESSAAQAGWNLTGTLSFWVFDGHPLNSIFWARKHDGHKDVLIVGYLFHTLPGVCCPAIEFVPGIEGEVFNQCFRHLSAIRNRSKLLFTWDERGPRMGE